MYVELTSLFGLDLYTTRGVYVGRIQDVVIESSEGSVVGLAVVNVNNKLFDVGNRGVIVPYRWVTSVGDIVLMMHPPKMAEKGRVTVGNEAEFRASVFQSDFNGT
ncbi:MAG: PRC-barrel domain-containing protein [Methermicoccaceae archaeon]